MNVNEALEQYRRNLDELLEADRKNAMAHLASASPAENCYDCSDDNPATELYRKLDAMIELFGIGLDPIRKDISRLQDEWAREKANAHQMATEMSLWLDFLGYLNQVIKPDETIIMDWLNRNTWKCIHPTFFGWISMGMNCPVCHKHQQLHS